MESFGAKLKKAINIIFNWNAIVSKFRASASCDDVASNATDAASFHRDISCYRMEEPPMIFTLVIYLNDTSMSVIPKSHKNLKYSTLDMLKSSSLTINIQAGDAVLFYATLLHRGNFKEKMKERRVVQCFDIFPDQHHMEMLSRHLLHLWCPGKTENENIGRIISQMVKVPGLNWIILFLHFHRTSNGYRINQQKLPNAVYILSAEAFRKRVRTYDDFQEGNVYATSPYLKLNDASPHINNILRKELYQVNTQPLVGIVVITIMLIIILKR